MKGNPILVDDEGLPLICIICFETGVLAGKQTHRFGFPQSYSSLSSCYNTFSGCRVVNCQLEQANHSSSRILIAPCKCSGTQKYVHVECLRKWQRIIVQSEIDNGTLQARHISSWLRNNNSINITEPNPTPSTSSRQNVDRATHCTVCQSRFSIRPPSPYIARCITLPLRWMNKKILYCHTFLATIMWILWSSSWSILASASASLSQIPSVWLSWGDITPFDDGLNYYRSLNTSNGSRTENNNHRSTNIGMGAGISHSYFYGNESRDRNRNDNLNETGTRITCERQNHEVVAMTACLLMMSTLIVMMIRRYISGWVHIIGVAFVLPYVLILGQNLWLLTRTNTARQFLIDRIRQWMGLTAEIVPRIRKGALLLSTERISSGIFRRSVVLIIEAYEQDCDVKALILNKEIVGAESRASGSRRCTNDQHLAMRQFIGGPVGVNEPGILLHSFDDGRIGNAQRLLPLTSVTSEGYPLYNNYADSSIMIGGTIEDISQIAKGNIHKKPSRWRQRGTHENSRTSGEGVSLSSSRHEACCFIYHGHTIWLKGQLEKEIAEGYWKVIPTACVADVLNIDGESSWRELSNSEDRFIQDDGT